MLTCISIESTREVFISTNRQHFHRERIYKLSLPVRTSLPGNIRSENEVSQGEKLPPWSYLWLNRDHFHQHHDTDDGRYLIIWKYPARRHISRRSALL